MKKEKGITLIALVVTIIVLLILAGVTLKIIGQSKLIDKADKSVSETKEAAAKEKLELLLAEYYADKMTDNKDFEKFWQEKQASREIDNYEKPEEGSNIWTIELGAFGFDVNEETLEIVGKGSRGLRPKATITYLTEGYLFEGDGTAQFKIDVELPAELAGATVTITEPEGVTKVGENYMVSKNGTYNFEVIATKDKAYTTTIFATIDKIFSVPTIEILNKKNNEFTINVTNNYPAEVGIQYIYYLDGSAKTEKVSDRSKTIDGLTAETRYTAKVEVYLPDGSMKDVEQEVTTAEIPKVWIWEDSDDSGEINLADVVTYGEEKFYVIATDNAIVTLLAKENIDPDTLKQCEGSKKPVAFSSEIYWTDSDGDLNNYPVPEGVTSVINTAKRYAKSLKLEESAGRLLNYSEAEFMKGSYDTILYGRYYAGHHIRYWLGTWRGGDQVGIVNGDGIYVSCNNYSEWGSNSIRPVVEISKSLISNAP